MKLKEYVGSKLMSHTMRINRAVPIENCLIGFNKGGRLYRDHFKKMLHDTAARVNTAICAISCFKLFNMSS